jgi:hypothetical protein
VRYCKDKDIEHRIRELQREGWSVVRGHKHGLLISPGGVKVNYSTTPSDGNAIRQFNRQIERVSNGKGRNTTY